MKLWSCFPAFIRKKKQEDKVNEFLSRQDALDKGLQSRKSSAIFGDRAPSGNQKNRRSSVKVMSVESSVAEHSAAVAEEAYVGKDEREDLCSIKREISDFDLQRGEAALCEEGNQSRYQGREATSDPLESKQSVISPNTDSPGSDSINKGSNDDNNDNGSWDGFQIGNSNLWPQNEWVSFSTESSTMARVSEWVKNLEFHHPPSPLDDIDHGAEDITYSPPPKKYPPRRASFSNLSNACLSKEISYANSIVQSQSSISTAAHICGAGLKVIPQIVHFSNLRYVNLSSNCIMTITPGLLPKGLHSLNLSRNKISTIEGLREQTRLRELDLSYNCIPRIGQGLSNCLRIKELYLAGNKISNVEGLHRLLKLRVLDVSFNKIATAEALGQLVSNYNSLEALNLLGNPIQSNMSEEQLRKAVCGLFPKLVYLNKQTIKPQRAGEVIRDSVAKAALGNSSWRSHRKVVKRTSQVGSVSSRGGLRNNMSV